MTLPTTQTALHLLTKRGAWSLVPAGALPTAFAPLAAHEILVRIESAGLNPVDWKIRTYGAAVEVFPAVLGTDAAGVVVEVGEEVEKVKIGDRV